MAETVYTDLQEGVFTITIDHPKVNALSLEIVRSLLRTFREVSQQKLARVVLLRATGDTFSGGQDIYEMLKAEGESYRKHMQETYIPLVIQIRRLELPVVVAINGTVAGAALGMALACDLRIASDQARFVVGFAGIGLAPDSGVSLFLPTLIGLGRAAEAAFTNVPISAQQALEWGMVNRVVPARDLQTSALDMAKALATGPIHAMGLAKRDFNKAVYPHLEEVLDYEAHIQEIARLGNEHKEGVRAFIEKREPKFQ